MSTTTLSGEAVRVSRDALLAAAATMSTTIEKLRSEIVTYQFFSPPLVWRLESAAPTEQPQEDSGKNGYASMKN